MNVPERWKTVVAVTGLILISSVVVSIHAQQAISGTVKVAGEITDPGLAEIPGARIRLYSVERILETTSDRSGRFQLNAPPGTYEVEVDAPGFKRFIKPDLRVADPRSARQNKPIEITVKMDLATIGGPVMVEPVRPEFFPCCCGIADSILYQSRQTNDADALAGIVTDGSTKKPVPAVIVRLFDTAGIQKAQQQTDEHGSFQFKQVTPGRYRLTFQHSAYNKLGSGEFWVATENRTQTAFNLVPLGKIVVCE